MEGEKCLCVSREDLKCCCRESWRKLFEMLSFYACLQAWWDFANEIEICERQHAMSRHKRQFCEQRMSKNWHGNVNKFTSLTIRESNENVSQLKNTLTSRVLPPASAHYYIKSCLVRQRLRLSLPRRNYENWIMSSLKGFSLHTPTCYGNFAAVAFAVLSFFPPFQSVSLKLSLIGKKHLFSRHKNPMFSNENLCSASSSGIRIRTQQKCDRQKKKAP